MSRTRMVSFIGGLLAVAGGCAKPDMATSAWPMPQYGADIKPDLADMPLADPPKILPQTHLAAGRLFESHGQIGKAIEQYRKAAALNHKSAEIHYRLGRVYGIAGEHAQAVEAYARAVELSPKNPALRNDFGFALMYQQRWAEAEKQIRQAIALRPVFPRAQINLALLMSRVGRFDEALVAFKEVLPEPDAYYNIGLLYRGQKKYVEAMDAFRRVLEISPEFPAAKVQLDQLTERTGAVDSGPAQKVASVDPPASESAPMTIQPIPIATVQQITPAPREDLTPATPFSPGVPEAATPPVAVEVATQDEMTDASPVASAARSPAGVDGSLQAFVGLDELANEVATRLSEADFKPSEESTEASSSPDELDVDASWPSSNASPEMAEWEGQPVTYRQLREILENDANCTHRMRTTTVAAGTAYTPSWVAALQPLRVRAGQPAVRAVHVAIEERPVVTPAASPGPIGRADFPSEPASPPADLETSKLATVMATESTSAEEPGLSATSFSWIAAQAQLHSPDDWRGPFLGLAALAATSENDLVCLRLFDAVRMGRVVFATPDSSRSVVPRTPSPTWPSDAVEGDQPVIPVASVPNHASGTLADQRPPQD